MRIGEPFRLGLLLLLAAGGVRAHDVPDFVAIRAFVAPRSGQLEVLVRVPFPALIDIDFPALPGSSDLDLPRVEPLLPGVATLWVSDLIDVYEDQTRLSKPRIVATRVSQEADQEFATLDQARAHVLGAKLPPETRVMWTGAALDVLLDYPIRSSSSSFWIQPRFGRLGVKAVTSLQFRSAAGQILSFVYEGDPGKVNLNPSWAQSARDFFGAGVSGMWRGTRQWLFLLCLALLFRGDSELVRAVAAFTVAYSLALYVSAGGWVLQAAWVDPLIQTVIAVSILYLAVQNLGMRMRGPTVWLTTFGFGLAHGLSLGSGLKEQLQFGGAHPVLSVLSFNAGIELLQLIALAALCGLLMMLFRAVQQNRALTLLLAAVLAHSAWHSLVENAGQFGQLLPWKRIHVRMSERS